MGSDTGIPRNSVGGRSPLLRAFVGAGSARRSVSLILAVNAAIAKPEGPGCETGAAALESAECPPLTPGRRLAIVMKTRLLPVAALAAAVVAALWLPSLLTPHEVAGQPGKARPHGL